MLKKSIILLNIALFASLTGLFGQQFTITVKADCPPEGENIFLNTDELQAEFIGQNIFGEVPLTVKFLDLSTGEPNNWKWQFGDGATDTVRHPVHVYTEPGFYTVKLTVANNTDTTSFKRINYICAVARGSCDSLNFPLPGDYALYPIDGNGYVSGNNSYGTFAISSYFDEYGDGGELVAGIFDFAVAVKASNNNIPIWFKVWDASGVSGSPGNVLDSISVPIASIVDDVEFGIPTILFFEEPVILDGPFYLGVELPQIFGDTLALSTNFDGDVEIGNGWSQNSDGSWASYASSQWNLEIDNAIFPVVCQPVGIENHYLEMGLLIYPVPATNRVNFVFKDASIKVSSVNLIDMTGRQVLSFPMDGSNFGSINIDVVAKGFYFLSFDTSAGAMNKKIVVRR